jgi:iodotyrosine deiodinase
MVSLHEERAMREPPPGAVFEPLKSYREYPVPKMIERSRSFAADLARRRTVRQFSDRSVPRTVIEACLEAASTAPSGAHLQPWHFVVVSDPDLKRRIRDAAEQAEREFYAHAPDEWLAALAPLGTDAHKSYLEDAPYLIAVFAQRYGSPLKEGGELITTSWSRWGSRRGCCLPRCTTRGWRR